MKVMFNVGVTMMTAAAGTATTTVTTVVITTHIETRSIYRGSIAHHRGPIVLLFCWISTTTTITTTTTTSHVKTGKQRHFRTLFR